MSNLLDIVTKRNQIVSSFVHHLIPDGKKYPRPFSLVHFRQMEMPEQRSRREKKLTPALLAFFETKNSTGFFASVAAAQRDQEDLARK